MIRNNEITTRNQVRPLVDHLHSLMHKAKGRIRVEGRNLLLRTYGLLMTAILGTFGPPNLSSRP